MGRERIETAAGENFGKDGRSSTPKPPAPKNRVKRDADVSLTSEGGQAQPIGTPDMAVPFKPAEVFGDALWLMSQSIAHKHLFLADMDWLVMPAILTKQFRLFKAGSKPYAFVSWAVRGRGREGGKGR